ncbi:type II toxin-antitoxin system death-on-curing family toxin, partial [Acetobacter senegalensis]|uniref:type II toxin-antitoxin system death-on-curing family toxin n=1 Tax=Acetobacter senegalensis TaxID=446692 RepID=UPI001EDDF292
RRKKTMERNAASPTLHHPNDVSQPDSYAYGIARNHPFNDANKRTAWSCCVLFLRLNGTRVQVSAPEAVEAMVALASGAMGEDAFAAWLRRCSLSELIESSQG